MSDVSPEEEFAAFSENWNHLQILSPTIKSRYGRIRKPKVSDDFINYNPEMEKSKSRKQSPLKRPLDQIPIKSPSPINKNQIKCKPKNYEVLHVTADSIIQEFCDKTSNHVDNKIRKFFKRPSKDSKTQYIHDTYVKKGIFNSNYNKLGKNGINNNTNDELKCVSEVLKIISKKSPERLDNKESTKKPLKTYSNKRRSSQEDSKFESFGLPDDPLLPYLSNYPSNIVLDLSCENLNKSLVDNWANLTDKEFDSDIEKSFSELNEITIQDNSKSLNNKIQCIQIENKSVNHENFKAANPINRKSKQNLSGIGIKSQENAIPNESDEIVSDPKYKNGDLVWARLGGHPYWPCLCIKDPESNVHFKKLGISRCIVKFHVRFFADNGRRAWVSGTSLLTFNGKLDIPVQTDINKKDKSAWTPNTKHYSQWLSAIDEAEMLINKTIQERISYFIDLLQKQDMMLKDKMSKKRIEAKLKKINDNTETKNDLASKVEKKRKNRNDNSDNESNESTCNIEVKRAKRSIYNTEKKNDVNTERKTVNKSPNKEEDLNTSHTNKSANKTHAKKEDLNTSNVSVDNKKLNNSFKQINSPKLITLEEQESLYNRNKIFRGVTKAKVCQICENHNKVLKCHGPCAGFYHITCAEKLYQKYKRAVIESKKTNQVQIINVKSKRLKNISIEMTANDASLKSLNLSEKIDTKMQEIMCKFNENTTYVDSTTDSSSSDENNSPTKTLQVIDNLFKCLNCSINADPPCAICCEYTSKQNSQVRQKCSIYKCGKFYHPECLKSWSQTQWSVTSTTKHKETNEYLDKFVCPNHVCHSCVANDQPSRSGDRVVRCLRCPVTYHATNFCLPAGTKILSLSQIICPRHLNQTKSIINANWCFICSEGGNLVCCDTCPTSVHAECIQINIKDDDSFICEDCECGRFPLYDEIVWVKLGAYRWWPAIIIFPNEIPANLLNPSLEKGDFVVKFFGTNNYIWVGRGRVFSFEEGDSSQSVRYRTKMDKNYQKALEEATIAYKVKKEFKNKILDAFKSELKPPPFIRIKSNKPVGNVRLFDGNISNTNPCECKPDGENPCGPDSVCLNRLLLTECDFEVCPAGDRCNNQQFKKRNYPPLIPWKTEFRGWGLKCLEAIEKGQFIIEYVGEMIDEQEYQRRIKKMHEQNDNNYYFLTIDKDRILDAGPKGNFSRFMNHSCQPNCETQKWTVNGDTRIGLFAVEDIPANVELTFNYNLESIGKEKKECKCDAPNCIGYIGVKAKQDESVKKTKKKKAYPVTKIAPIISDQPCFICEETGDVLACHSKICNKHFHLKCVNLETWPEGRWICPCHNCNICTKRTIRSCIKCINSYCPSHAIGNIRHDKVLGFVCLKHDPIEIRANGTVKEVVSNLLTQEVKVTTTTDDDDFLEPNKSVKNKVKLTTVKLSKHQKLRNGKELNLNPVNKQKHNKRTRNEKNIALKTPKNSKLKKIRQGKVVVINNLEDELYVNRNLITEFETKF